MVTEFHWPSGSNYVGEWENGKTVILHLSKGEKYIGEHIDGKPMDMEYTRSRWI